MTAFAHAAAPAARLRAPSSRAALVLATVGALSVGLVTGHSAPAEADADLVVVLRGMAAIKGGLACLALAACFWRLSRPAAPWRTAIYVIGPPLMAAGALAVWRLEALGLAALGLHVALFAVLAAALSDPDFVALPGRRRREGLTSPERERSSSPGQRAPG